MKRLPRLGSLRALAIACVLGSWLAPPVDARVEITLDAATLTGFLGAVTAPTVILPLPSGNEIALNIRDVRVTGFDAAGKNGRGQVLASLRVGIPALGLDLPLTTRLSLEVAEEKGGKMCVLRFDRVEVPLPVTGPLDIGTLLPAYRVPAEADWLLPTRGGDVGVKSRLVETRVGAEAIRLGFDLDMSPPAQRAAPPARAGSGR